MMSRKFVIAIAILISLLFFYRAEWLAYLGHSLVVDDPAATAEVAVVLTTGVDYVPRLLQAAQLYRDKRVKKIIINGNRKTDAIRKLEAQGFVPACQWYENSLRILEMYGVPRDRIWTVVAEDVFDTVSEAQAIRPLLLENDIDSMILTTSKFHTRRARFVWRKVMAADQGIYSSAAVDDPFDPDSWWQDGRQVKQVMGEYGGMAYYLWKRPWRKSD
jgi:uncharacterized SAM-binding protein YcdF (DUF218 family)